MVNRYPRVEFFLQHTPGVEFHLRLVSQALDAHDAHLGHGVNLVTFLPL
jgi:hypothetical protein